MVLRRKVQVFIYHRDPEFEVLLLKRTKKDKGDWHPVTGNVERHEEIRAAAMREAYEETDLEIEPEPLGMTFTYETKEGRAAGRYHETVFAASAPENADVGLSDEHDEAEWCTPKEALERLTWPEQKKALEAVVARYGR